jgi:acetylornithine deacetylase
MMSMVDLKHAVLSKINEKDLVNCARQLITIPSTNPPGEQEEISKFLASQLKDIGFKVSTPTKVPGKPNVIGTIMDKGPKLLFCGHMDTAPITENEKKLSTVDPFGGVVKDGKIYGRGAVDMKGSSRNSVCSESDPAGRCDR